MAHMPIRFEKFCISKISCKINAVSIQRIKKYFIIVLQKLFFIATHEVRCNFIYAVSIHCTKRGLSVLLIFSYIFIQL